MSTDELPDEVIHAYRVYEWTKQEMTKLAELQEHVRAVIEERMGESEELYIDGRKALTWKPETQTILDGKKALELYPDLRQKALKTINKRPMRLVEDNDRP